jgi:hypothetical protein
MMGFFCLSSILVHLFLIYPPLVLLLRIVYFLLDKDVNLWLTMFTKYG